MSKQPPKTPAIECASPNEGARSKGASPGADTILPPWLPNDPKNKARLAIVSWTEITADAGEVPPIDDTVNRPWRHEMLGYVNVELTADDGKRHIVAKEEIVWAAFNGRPPEGHRVGFLDGDPENCSLDNLVLLPPGEAELLDEANVWRLPASARSERDRNQLVVQALLDDVHVDQVFIADGYAVLFKGMFQCAPKDPEWRFDLGLDLVEKGPGEAVLNGGLPGDKCTSTGDARYTQSRFGVSIEAVMVVGPLRAALFHPSTHDDVLNGLRGLRKLIVDELRKAVFSREAVFTPKFAEWMAQHLPSPEALLESARSECKRRKDDPAIAHLLGVSAFDDSPSRA